MTTATELLGLSDAPSLTPPAASGMPGFWSTQQILDTFPPRSVTESINDTEVWHDLVNITGEGYITRLFLTKSSAASAITWQVEVIIDGLTVLSEISSSTASTEYALLAGCAIYSGTGSTYTLGDGPAVNFKTSLQVRVKRTAGTIASNAILKGNYILTA